jgi:hypothetical protein
LYENRICDPRGGLREWRGQAGRCPSGLPERALSEGALSERALSEGALSERALSEGALSERALSERALSERALAGPIGALR